MRTLFWSGWIVGLVGCGPSLEDCASLCELKGACIEEEIDAFDADWGTWTGHDDRDEYEASCLDVFMEASAAGGRKTPQICARQLEEHRCEIEPLDR
ncbi:MAG TPA: hypothetical protein ENK18_00670 [Deltaproteobacteria bacterium]|nr:hypothetical protein [Deltaproteobacteria bacterium]